MLSVLANIYLWFSLFTIPVTLQRSLGIIFILFWSSLDRKFIFIFLAYLYPLETTLGLFQPLLCYYWHFWNSFVTAEKSAVLFLFLDNQFFHLLWRIFFIWFHAVLLLCALLLIYFSSSWWRFLVLFKFEVLWLKFLNNL